MDKLEQIFALQKRFDNELAERRSIDFSDGPLWVQREMLAMLVEMAEVLSEVNYKWWKDATQVNSARVLEEMVDVLHFFVAACLKMGFSAQDLYDEYVRKNKVNAERQRGLSDREGYKSGGAD